MACFKHSSARTPSDPRLPMFMQNMHNHLGNRTLSSQTLRNIRFDRKELRAPPEFGQTKSRLLKWGELVRSPKTPLRLAKEFLCGLLEDVAALGGQC